MDINTGYIRDSNGLENLFKRDADIYSETDFGNYGRIINELKIFVEAVFGVTDLHFTAPTFMCVYAYNVRQFFN